MERRRVAITGLGLLTGLGTDLKTQWALALEGKSGVGPITLWDASKYPVRFAAEVREFNAEKWIEKKETRRIDRFAQLGLAAACEAVKDAGLDFAKEPGDRCGTVIGSGIGGILEIEEQTERRLTKGPEKVSPFLVPKLMLNAASGLVSIRFGLRGPTYATASACAASSHAIANALRFIQHGEADVMLAGGAEAAVSPTGLSGFANMGALSFKNETPQTASRPFDKDRDGFVMGEGAGILVLEEMERARKRGARIYGELKGCGMGADAYHVTAPEPEGKGAGLCMRKALADAGVNPEDVGYVNAHGTSTPLGDKAETAAIKAVFGAHAKKLAVSSTKSMVGHTLGASGAVELVVTALSVAEGVVHPTINYTTPDPECDLDYVPNRSRKLPLKVAISNSFGFGGHNVTLVVAKA